MIDGQLCRQLKFKLNWIRSINDNIASTTMLSSLAESEDAFFNQRPPSFNNGKMKHQRGERRLSIYAIQDSSN